ncbi:MAG: hypothetical protein HKN50_13810 [Gammaproteobacteria bacterium]|nr:hypothetical protein [Gammaproteobacteria bacterium]
MNNDAPSQLSQSVCARISEFEFDAELSVEFDANDNECFMADENDKFDISTDTIWVA